MSKREVGGGSGIGRGSKDRLAIPTSEGAGEILLYETEDGRARVECCFSDESLWMSQALMAELFQTTPQNITLHLKALNQEGEIVEAATCKDYLQVRTESARQIRRSVKHSLDEVLALEEAAKQPEAPKRRPAGGKQGRKG